MKTILALIISASLIITPARAETIQCKKQGDLGSIAIVLLFLAWAAAKYGNYLTEQEKNAQIEKLKNQCGDKQ